MALRSWDEPSVDWSVMGTPMLFRDSTAHETALMRRVARKVARGQARTSGGCHTVDWGEEGLKGASRWVLRQRGGAPQLKRSMPTRAVPHMPKIGRREGGRPYSNKMQRALGRMLQPGGGSKCNRWD